MVVTRARSSRRHRSNRIDTPPRVVVVVDGDDDGDGVDGDGDGVDARATTRGRVGAAPVPMESITASRATEPTHARTHAPTRRPRRRRVSLRSRPFVHARLPSSSDARRHVGIIRNTFMGTTRARASPPHRRTTVTHRASCVARWNTFGTRRVVAATPRAGAGRVPRDASERQFAFDGNAWMEINGRVGIVARGAKVTHKCVSPNTRHHGDRHSPCSVFHQAFIPAENQPSPSEQGT